MFTLAPSFTLQVMRHHRTESFSKACLVGVFFFFPISLAVANTLMALTLLSWLITGHFRSHWQVLRTNPMTLPALLMYGLIVLGCFYTPATWPEIWQHLGKYSKFLFLLIAISLLQETAWQRRCWQAFTAAMLITLISTYANIEFDLPWSNTHNQGWGVDHTVFNHHIPQELLMSFFAAMCLQQLFHAKHRTHQFLWAALCCMTALSVTHLSIGRTGYTAIAICLVIVSFFNFRSFQRYWMVAVVVLCIAALAVTSTQLQDRVKLGIHEVKTTNHKEITSLGARVLMWKTSLESIKQSPIIGHGTGSYHSLAEKAFNDKAWCGIVCFHPHNQFLFFGVEYGVIGILAYAFYFYRPLRYALRDRPKSQPLLLSFLGIFALDSMTHGAMWLSVENHFFTFLLALFMANAKNTPDKELKSLT